MPGARSISIMVVDDTPQNLEELQALLEGQSYRVSAFSSARPALEAMVKSVPDLILLDIRMPEIDGIEMCRMLKSTPLTADIPVLFISSQNNPELIARAFGAGGVDYVLKPFREQEVLARVQTHLKLMKARRRLQKHQEKLSETVKQRTAELEDALDRARESDRLKTAFLASVSHELRTPLTSIIGFSDILQHTAESDDDRQYASIISNSGRQLLGLIEDLLDLVMGDKGLVTVRNRKFDLTTWFAAQSTVLRELLTSSGKEDRIELLFHPPEQPGQMVEVDPDKMAQILQHLFKNAIKFTEKGQIAFGMEKTAPDRLQCYVRDTGIGIATEDQKRIFGLFRQGDDSDTRKYGGLGIGLAVAHKIALAMGGKIRLVSRPAQGSIFYLEVPLTSEG